MPPVAAQCEGGLPPPNAFAQPEHSAARLKPAPALRKQPARSGGGYNADNVL
ncbi:hypothetical protein [Chthonomonas calidirosea]|uniref:hypothetical protein n=1 Tax=Chthonomonas calidirosea TaxID=454171 RepID=UPI0012E3E45B|nr:hypothetical protein [Chthonomonas calidirosea]